MKVKSLLLDTMIFGFLVVVATGFFFIEKDIVKENFNYYAITILVSMFVGVGVSVALAIFKVNSLGQHLFNYNHAITVTEATPWYKTVWGLEIIVGFIAAFVVSLHTTEFNIKEVFNADGASGALRIFQGMAHPSTEIIPDAILAMIETVFMAFLATTLAIPIAFVLSFLCAKNIMGHSTMGQVIYFGLRMFLNLIRSMEPIVWAIIFSVWVGLGPFAGTFALMIHSIASLTKQYSEMVEAVDKGPIEGIQSTGAGTLQMLWFAIVPQVILPYVSFTIYRWDINVRMATIIGLVGGGGIGNMLIQYQNQAQWSEVGALIILIALVVWAMDTSSAYIREAVK